MPLVATWSPGAHRDQLSYRVLRTLADVSPAVAEVQGYTRYRVEGRPRPATRRRSPLVDRGGIARDLASRTDRSPELRGTKHRVANEREVLVALGRSDGRPIVIVPEVKDGQATGITLLHVRFADRLPEATARAAAAGLPQPLRGAARRGARDRAPPSARTCWPPSRSTSCSPSRSTSSPTAGVSADPRPRAAAGCARRAAGRRRGGALCGS